MPSIDDYHWTESDIHTIQARPGEIILTASVPKYSDMETIVSVEVSFTGVRRSSRQVSEYLGDPKSNDGFKAHYTINDPFGDSVGKIDTYHIEGVCLISPVAWIDWEIEASAVCIVEKAT